MKKLFLQRVLLVSASTALLYVATIFLYTYVVFSGDKNGGDYWIPNVLNTTGGRGYTFLRLKEAEKEKDVDVLFVGSSHVYRGFDVRIFERNNLESFNLGTSAQSILNSYFLLNEYLPTTDPELVVLDLYWGIADADGTEAAIDILSNSELNESVLEMVWAVGSEEVFSSLLSTSLIRLHTPLPETHQAAIKGTRYVSGGFMESSLTHNRLRSEDIRSIPRSKAKFSKIQLRYLRKIISLCKKHNTKLVLVLTPVTKEYKASVINWPSYVATISNIAKQSNVSFYNYNDRKDLTLSTSTDFADLNHLSQSGVEKFNGLFISDLYTSGVLNPSLTLHKHKGPSPPSKSWQARKRRHTAVMRPGN